MDLEQEIRYCLSLKNKKIISLSAALGGNDGAGIAVNSAMDSAAHVAEESARSIDALEQRMEKLTAWLETQAPECFDEQAHLREGSAERVYWHYGYLVALRDMQRQMRAAKDHLPQ